MLKGMERMSRWERVSLCFSHHQHEIYAARDNKE